MASLFNIEEKYLSILDTLEENGGELTPELESELEITKEDFENKCTAYYYITKQLEGDCATITSEIERLKSLQASKERNIERLRDTLKAATKVFGEDGKTGNKKLKFTTISMWTVNKAKVILSNDFNNKEFINYKITDKVSPSQLEEIQKATGLIFTTETVPDKSLIKNELEAGVEIDGATLLPYDYLVIK